MSAAWSCPLCGATDTAVYWPTVWGDSRARVIHCEACESYFLDPPRSPEEQTAFDQAYDTYIGKREAQVAEHADQRFAVLVDESIETRWRDLAAWFPPGCSALEIGAERGGFLDRLAGVAVRRVGVDACPEYAALLAARGYGGYRYLEHVPDGERFDRVCFFSLLEHVPNPAAFLAAAAARLAPGGRIVLEVPCSREPLLTLYDVPAFKDFYFQAMHPWVFGPRAVERLVNQAGLKIDSLRFKQRYGIDNHLNWLKRGTPGGDDALRRLFAGKTATAYAAALEEAGCADTLYVLAGPA